MFFLPYMCSISVRFWLKVFQGFTLALKNKNWPISHVYLKVIVSQRHTQRLLICIVIYMFVMFFANSYKYYHLISVFTKVCQGNCSFIIIAIIVMWFCVINCFLDVNFLQMQQGKCCAWFTLTRFPRRSEAYKCLYKWHLYVPPTQCAC